MDRLLQSPAAIQNLNQVVMSYYQLGNLDAVVKDPMVYPDFTKGMINSMYTESQKFIEGTLWSGKLVDLLTSRKSNVDANLAKLYGVSANGATDTNFVPVEFAVGQRAGILTQGSMLAMFANTNNTSVVHRGLYVNGNILCNPSPPPPPASVTAQVEMQRTDPNATERQKSDLEAHDRRRATGATPTSTSSVSFSRRTTELAATEAAIRATSPSTRRSLFPSLPAVARRRTSPSSSPRRRRTESSHAA